jgi:hypothetical protein
MRIGASTTVGSAYCRESLTTGPAGRFCLSHLCLIQGMATTLTHVGAMSKLSAH